MTLAEIDLLKLELRELNSGSVCRTESEWETVNLRIAEICRLLGIEFPEDEI